MKPIGHAKCIDLVFIPFGPKTRLVLGNVVVIAGSFHLSVCSRQLGDVLRLDCSLDRATRQLDRRE